MLSKTSRARSFSTATALRSFPLMSNAYPLTVTPSGNGNVNRPSSNLVELFLKTKVICVVEMFPMTFTFTSRDCKTTSGEVLKSELSGISITGVCA